MSERVVVVNAGKMNYDHALDFSILSNDVQVYEDSTNAELIERIQGACGYKRIACKCRIAFTIS